MAMKTNKYLVQIPVEEGNYIILDTLHGKIYKLKRDEYYCLLNPENSSCSDTIHDLLKNKLLYLSEDDFNKDVERAYLDFIRKEKSLPLHYMVIPTYYCNLACIYCYEKGIKKNPEFISEKALSKLFHAINLIEAAKKSNVKSILTIFGGEPLLSIKREFDIIAQIVKESREQNLALNVVTNGVGIPHYLSLLKEFNSIQITFDGDKSTHDKYRIFPNGKGTFDIIINNLCSLLDEISTKTHIALRLHVHRGKENSVYNLYCYLKEIGILKRKNVHLYVMPVHNYLDQSLLTEGIKNELESLLYLVKNFPSMSKEVIIAGHSFATSLNYLINRNNIYFPKFRHCEANINQYVFDLYGDIYPCDVVVGIKKFSVGKFIPNLQFYDSFKKWRETCILTLPCKECSYALLCGGGCNALTLLKDKKLRNRTCSYITKEILKLYKNLTLEFLKVRIGDNL